MAYEEPSLAPVGGGDSPVATLGVGFYFAFAFAFIYIFAVFSVAAAAAVGAIKSPIYKVLE